MTKPVLLAVDDRPADLAAVRAELRKRYAADYEVFAESSPTLSNVS